MGVLVGAEGRGGVHAHDPAEDRMPAGLGPLAFLTWLLHAKPLWEQEETMDLAPSGCEQAIREALGGHVPVLSRLLVSPGSRATRTQIPGPTQDPLCLVSGVGCWGLQGVLVCLAVRATSHRGGMATQVSFQSRGCVPRPMAQGSCSKLSWEEAIPPCPWLRLALRGRCRQGRGLSEADPRLVLCRCQDSSASVVVGAVSPGTPVRPNPLSPGPEPQDIREQGLSVQKHLPPSRWASPSGATRHAQCTFAILRHVVSMSVAWLCQLPGVGSRAVCGCQTERLALTRGHDAQHVGVWVWGRDPQLSSDPD